MSTVLASIAAAPTSMASPASTSPAGSSPTGSGGGGGGGGGSSGAGSSPLLFFVALGFGVVFTNLWIIVGVKYCFRYNARNRARLQDENGEPIDLANMPPHRRRRREKKLMTMDEVNERFPVTKYKTWVSTRAAQGLPTEGGVSQSRAASVRDAEGTIEPIRESSKSVVTADVASNSDAHDDAVPTSPTTSAAHNENVMSDKSTEAAVIPAAHENKAETATTEGAALASTAAISTHSGIDDEDDAIPAAIPGAAEMLEAPGDSCAICIDVIEEEEDVRGLSCGHAFHATCIDPWLTNRRACCPLCKADYYVPKIRPGQTEGQNEEEGSAPTNADGSEQIRRPSIAAGLPAGAISRYVPMLGTRTDLPPERRTSRGWPAGQPPANGTAQQTNEQTLGGRFTSMFRRHNADAAPAAPTAAPAAAQRSGEEQPQTTPESNNNQQTPRARRWIPSLNLRRGEQVTEPSPSSPAPPTPRQLEAGDSR